MKKKKRYAYTDPMCCRCREVEKVPNSAYCRECRSDYRRTKVHKYWGILKRYKVMKGCANCGYNKHFAALQFNHIDPMDKHPLGLTQLVKSASSWKRIKNEVAKCEILCANCHAEHSYREGHHLLDKSEDNRNDI